MNSNQNDHPESDFDALAVVGHVVAEEAETVLALEALFQLPALLPEHKNPRTLRPHDQPNDQPNVQPGRGLTHRQRAQQHLNQQHEQDRQQWQQELNAAHPGDPVLSLADGRAPLAQGDVLVVPVAAGGRWPARYCIPDFAQVVDDAAGRPQHVLNHASTGVIWAPYTHPDQLAAGAVGLLEVPEAGQVQLTHLGRDHDPLTIGPGLWLIRRQRAYAGTWLYNHLTD